MSKQINGSAFRYDRCEIVDKDGISFIKVSPNANLIHYDAFLIRDEILRRYLSIGKVLDDIGILDKMWTRFDFYGFKSIEDFKILYYNTPDEKELINNLILSFVKDFGFLSLYEEEDFFSDEELKKTIEYYVSDKDFNSEAVIAIVLDICFHYGGIKYEDDHFSTFCNIEICFCYEKGEGWIASYDFPSLYNLIRYALAEQKTNPNTTLIQCAYCKEWTIQSNPKAEYCSPSCRNRANVRKSRAKKKQQGGGL